ncbi:hypothetical protein D3Z36_17010 [Lachnospiraceae bacterium]|nr:hypothetical protein [Lachnospiraceae bacterium]
MKTAVKKYEKTEKLKEAAERYSDSLWKWINLRLWMEYGDPVPEHRRILWVEKIVVDIIFP